MSLPQRTTIRARPSTSTLRGAASESSAALPTSIHGISVVHSCLEACLLGHHALVPGRVERQLDACFAHRGYALDLVLHVIDQDLAHPAAGGRESQAHLAGACPVLVGLHGAVVHQAEVDDVDRDLRVVAGPHLRPGELAHVVLGGVGRQFRRLHRLLADGIGILAGDTKQVALHVDGEAAAQRLGDIAGLAGFEADLDAGGDDDRFDLAVDDEGLVFVTTHVSLRGDGGRAALQRGIQGMPAEARAFDARRELAHAGQGCELAERLVGRRVLLSQQRMDAAVQRQHRLPVLALYRLRHERCRSGRDRAVLALEADVLDAVVLHPQPYRQPVPAQRVVTLGVAVAGLDPAEIPRAPVVIEDDVAIELLEIHYANTSRALIRAATRLATSASVL